MRFHLGLASEGGDAASAWLELASQADSAVDRALALEGAMPLLHAAQAWIEPSIERVEPAPASTPWPSSAQMLTLGVTGLGRLALPWAALRAGHGLDASPHAIEWPALACELVLESLTQERIDARALERGSVLLLPGTFAAAETAQAVAARPQHVTGLPALDGLIWDARVQRLRVADTALQSAPLEAAAWTVVAEPPIELSAARWFGAATPAQDLPPPARAGLHLHGRSVAHGVLVPAGSGTGLLIEACEATPLQAA